MDALHECTAPLQSNPPNFRLPDPGAEQTPVSEISTSLRALQAAGIVVETSERRRGGCMPTSPVRGC